MKFVSIYGSVREHRQGIKAARFVARQVEGRGHTSVLIDPMEHRLALLDKMYKEYDEGRAPGAMEAIATELRSADAFIVVSGEYNHSIPPALSNLLDHFMKEYFWRPAGIACYSAGPFGGVRAAIQLRALLGEIGLVTVPTIFPMSRVGQSFADDGTAIDDAYAERIGKFLDELEWYAEALAARREKGVPYD